VASSGKASMVLRRASSCTATGSASAGLSVSTGLLHVDLVREIPEAMKPRAILIASSGKRNEADCHRD
jgi:hypothetical protein